jgi:MGT family glycosyltransferase
MSTKKTKNILFIPGVLHGHFPGDVEIIKLLVTLGYNVTCYVLDTFAERLKNTGAKIEVFSIDRSDFDKLPPGVPKIALNLKIVKRSYDAVFTMFLKDKSKYDYLLHDMFFSCSEINKIFKFPMSNVITIYPSFCLSDMKVIQFAEQRAKEMEELNKKYNLNLGDYVSYIYHPPSNNKLILTSKPFHYRSEEVDKSFHFFGPSIEERTNESNFNYKKDPNKKLIYISLGTISHQNDKFYLQCIESFKDSENYQVLMSVGNTTDMKIFKEIPSNFSIFNYVVQAEVLKQTDIFITHGGLNSVQEGILNHVFLIVIPVAYDAFENAKMIEKFEAGISLDFKSLNVDVLRNAVNTIESNKEKYQKGIEKIFNSFQEARNQRKEIKEKLLP